MEFIEYLKIIKKNVSLIIAVTILFVLAGVGYYFYTTSFYEGNVVFSVAQAEQNDELEESRINYDGYYLIEAKRNFGDKAGNYLLEKTKDKDYTNSDIFAFQIERLSNVDYKIILKSKNSEAIKDFIRFIKLDLKNKIENLSSETNEKIIFTAFFHSENIKKISLNPNLFFGFLIFSGFILGVIISFFREYFLIKNL